jgi:hypothetical protein
VSYEFRTDKWAELYSKRIDDMIAALKTRGVPIIWVGLPAIRGTKSSADMSYLDELYRARADKAGIVYIDVWDAFVDDQGRYIQDGPDFEGQTRRLRTYDGVYFTKAGAEKLGHYVELDLRRVLSSHGIPVALPTPDEQSPVRDAVGPVLPLNAIGKEKNSELLGAAKRPADRESDPLATRVFNRGEAVVAPPGRADDFSWPHADTSGLDVEPAADTAHPRSSVGISHAGEGNKPKATKSGASKDTRQSVSHAPVRPATPQR